MESTRYEENKAVQIIRGSTKLDLKGHFMCSCTLWDTAPSQALTGYGIKPFRVTTAGVEVGPALQIFSTNQGAVRESFYLQENYAVVFWYEWSGASPNFSNSIKLGIVKLGNDDTVTISNIVTMVGTTNQANRISDIQVFRFDASTFAIVEQVSSEIPNIRMFTLTGSPSTGYSFSWLGSWTAYPGNIGADRRATVQDGLKIYYQCRHPTEYMIATLVITCSM